MKIFIAIPVYQGMCNIKFMESVSALMILLKQENIDFFYFSLTSESLISRARNVCVSKFLNSDCTHLMFIDSDIVFHPRDVIQLVNSNKLVIGGVYPFKSLSFKNIKDVINDSHNLMSLIENSASYYCDKKSINEVSKIDYIQTGFLCIQKAVFEMLINTHKNELEYDNDIPGYETFACDGKMYNFFQVGVESGKYLSEDYGFCRLLTTIDIPIYVDPNIKLTHIGQFFFHG